MSINNCDLTDEEKYFFLKLSYIDIDLENFTTPYSIERMLIHAKEIRESENKNFQIIDQLYEDLERLSQRNPSLKEINIIGYENHNSFGLPTHDTETGFVGYALEDAQGNRGFLFRGSELETFEDWEDNISSGLTGTSTQIEQANEFFNKWSTDENGNPLDDVTYSLYGHSKGSNLATEVFVNNLDKDITAYGVNGQPIYWFDLTNEQKKALRGDRYTFIVHEGDFVSGLGYVDYVDTVVKVKNKNQDMEMLEAILYPHALDSVEFDENGQFVSIADHPNMIGRQVTNTVVLSIQLKARLAEHFSKASNIFFDPFARRATALALKDVYYFTIDTIKVLLKYAAQKANEAIEHVRNQWRKVVLAIALGKTMHERLIAWMDQEVSFIQSIFNSGKKLFERMFSGKDYHSAIIVDTGELRRLAMKLQGIQSKISQVDRSLSRVSSLVDPENRITVFSIGHDYELKQCIDFLHDAAYQLEATEQRIMQDAQALNI